MALDIYFGKNYYILHEFALKKKRKSWLAAIMTEASIVEHMPQTYDMLYKISA